MNPGDEYQRYTGFSLELGGLITIPADALQPQLSYYGLLDLASNTTAYVDVTTGDGQTWTTLATYTGDDNDPAWTLREHPLDAYVGQTIRVRFRAVQGSAYYRDHWHVDDVRIETAAAPTPTPTPTNTPTPTPTPTLTPTPTPTATPTSQSHRPAGLAAPVAGLSQALAAQPASDSSSVSSPAPGVQSAGVVTTTRVITYTYDPLGRLVEADYSTGEQFEYAYRCMGLSRGKQIANLKI